MVAKILQCNTGRRSQQPSGFATDTGTDSFVSIGIRYNQQFFTESRVRGVAIGVRMEAKEMNKITPAHLL
jgi:hypothetical protein